MFATISPIMRQAKFEFRTWGGRRKGAGRKPKGERAGVPHRARPRFEKRQPIHVTVKVAPDVWNLRSRRSVTVIQTAVWKSADRFGARVVELSVQGDHLHMIVEAENTAALVRSMKGLTSRVAKGLNRMMRRKGRVFADRYHTHVLRTPTEVRRAVHYLRNNHRKHMEEKGVTFSPTWIDPYATFALPPARTWPLRGGPP